MAKSRDEWTLRQELDHQLRLLREGKSLDANDDLVLGHLMAKEIAALKKDAREWEKIAASLPKFPEPTVQHRRPSGPPRLYIVK